MARPREIAATATLIPAIGELISEESFDAFRDATTIDLRQIKEAVIASVDAGQDDALLYLVRHAADARAMERKFRDRIVDEAQRSIDRPDVIRVSGKVGTRARAFASIGADVVAYQEDGDPERGPLRIATLRAMGELRQSPAALAKEPLRSMRARFGDAPLIALAPGPFEGDWARAAGGLVGISEAVGLAVRPSARGAIWLHLAMFGDFSTDAQAASERLAMAWSALAETSFGHLLGLNEPVELALPTHTSRSLGLAIELDPNKLARGLAAATHQDVESIMRF